MCYKKTKRERGRNIVLYYRSTFNYNYQGEKVSNLTERCYIPYVKHVVPRNLKLTVDTNEMKKHTQQLSHKIINRYSFTTNLHIFYSHGTFNQCE